MKKNLRIVSVAAAALLAVAPVAATVVPAASTVSAASDTDLAPKDTKVVTTEGNVYLYTIEDGKYVPTMVNSEVLSLAKGTQLSVNGKKIKKTIYGPKDAHSQRPNWGEQELYPVSYNNQTLYVAARQIAKATKPADTSSPNFNFGNDSVFNADANVAVNITAVAKTEVANGSFSGNITATVGGQNYTALLHTTNTNGVNVSVKNVKTNAPVNSASDLEARTLYEATISGVTFNLGSSNANKQVSLTLPDNAVFEPTAAQKSEVSNNGGTFTATADNNGVLTVPTVKTTFYALDPTDMKGINFYSVTTGEQVKSGSVDLHAVNGQGNVESVYAALNREYKATQVFKDKHETRAENEVRAVLPINNIRDQLTKQGIKVDGNGYFTAPSSLSLTLNAKSPYNGATASLPVTVNFDNATPAASQETTKTVKIMHIATIYDKNGKATHEPALRAYNTVSVVSDPVSLKDEKGNDAGKFYKLAGKDQYIKVGNVDGTSRSLKHNSYVYKSTGKRRGKTVLKKGSSVTTYGKSFMIAGHQMYRIGENQYVKKAR